MAEEKTFSVGVQTSSPKRISVTSNVSENPITASADTGLYYSQLAKNWAIGEGLIQNEDYSSKTWAGESKSSADLSKMYSEAASLDLTNLENRIIEYDEQLNTTITEGLENINTSVTSGVETIETLQANSIAEITTNKESALSDINTAETNTLAQISTLANESISDINAVGKSYDNLTYRNITNCLLEVPQRIKYTLEDGTLTIKAGSVVIVPYGTEDLTAQYPVGATFMNDNCKVYDTQFVDGKFFVWAELMNDTIDSAASTAVHTRVISINLIDGQPIYNAKHYATSAPSYTTSVQYYHTTNNECWHTDSNGTPDAQASLPVMLVTSDTTNIYAQVDQVFNGMGYIGSTLWVDKGVKGLIPNGRNEDGTLNNIEIVTNEIAMSTSTSTQDYTIRLSSDGKLAQRQTRYNLTVKTLNELYALNASVAYLVHVVDENRNYYTSNSQWNVTTDVRIITATLTNGVVSNFQPKQPFRAVDYNDKSEISGWGMPSNKYIDLTLGASGSTYTAPANGWVVFCKRATASAQEVELMALPLGQGVRYRNTSASSNFLLMVSLPVKKGQQFCAGYTAGGETEQFTFIYADGEV